MLEIIPKDIKVNFVGHRYVWLAISTALVVVSVVLLMSRGFNYGIDFVGGAEIQLKFDKPVSVSELRDLLGGGGLGNLVIQQLGETQQNEFLVKLRGEDAESQEIIFKMESSLSQKMQKADFEIQRVDVVGEQAGKALRKSGFLSMFYALLCILVYVAVRFDYRYGPGAVVALAHDVILTMGIFSLTQKEFNLQIVAAILTVIGYSNNDTIIVYDRIREALIRYPNRTFKDNVNRSINETLSRTLLTSLFTLLVVVALMVLGGGVIYDFAFTMMIGILVGTYSSIFIASPILILVTDWQQRRLKKVASMKNTPLIAPRP
ncbi:MAG: protein translocase subunit SecF [Bdellovibrionota bacterium]